jgi:hypothetical protein
MSAKPGGSGPTDAKDQKIRTSRIISTHVLTSRLYTLTQMSNAKVQKTRTSRIISTRVGTCKLYTLILLQSRHVLARLRPDMYFKMPKCQNVGDLEVGDPKLATRKDTTIGAIVDYRCWNTIPACQPDRGLSAAIYIQQSAVGISGGNTASLILA